MKFSFINLGCKINQIEMEQVAHGLTSKGYSYSPNIIDSNFLIINTCTVTSNADKKSLTTIKKYSRLANLQNVFVTGCYSELESELAKKIHPKNRIIAQKDKNKIPEIIHSIYKKQDCLIDYKQIEELKQYESDRFSAFKNAKVNKTDLENAQVDFFEHTRAFIKIQDGCNAFCSYCRIPFARGVPVSRNYLNIINHVKRLRNNGIKEIVLSGINIGKYFDRETKKKFSNLLEDILYYADGLQIKISSIEPFSLDEDFFKLISHPNLAPHIHLPLQGLSDNILERMNRRYRLADYKKIIEKIYSVRQDFSIAADVIVGYPGESDQDFDAGLNFIRECGLSKLHVFPFSSRPLTNDFLAINSKNSKKVEKHDYKTAPEYGNHMVSDVSKKNRAKILRALSEELELTFAKKIINTKQKLIIEKNVDYNQESSSIKKHSEQNSFFQGTTEYNLKGVVAVNKAGPLVQKGSVVKVIIKNINPLLFEKVAEISC